MKKWGIAKKVLLVVLIILILLIGVLMVVMYSLGYRIIKEL